MRFLHGSNLSNKIYELSERVKERVYVATPFASRNAHELLSEKIREVSDVKFIVNFCERNIRSGSISPEGVKKLKRISRGIHSCDYLHGKLYLFDKTAVVTSANLSETAFSGGSLEFGIAINEPDTVNEIAKLYTELWKGSRPITIDEIRRAEEIERKYSYIRKHEGVPNYLGFPAGGSGRLRHWQKWKKPLDFEPIAREDHIIININWSSNEFQKECSNKQKRSEDQRLCCHEANRCIGEERDGCASSVLFRNYEYATSWKAIKKGRIAFFIASNPNIGGEYYVVGFLLMASNEPTGNGYWGKQKVYYFNGDPNLSAQFPRKGKNVAIFDRNLTRNLNDFIDWSRKPPNWDDAGWVGLCMRKNPRYISEENARILLKECYKITGNKVAQKVYNEIFG